MRPATTAATPPDTCCSEELMDMYEPRSAGFGSADMSAVAEIMREKIPTCSTTTVRTSTQSGLKRRCV
jgi:hypothetical protein